ncbi:response regulator [Thalassomonas haliotis]|uniref:Response regulator n=1 Tax=Thalassomonas haliotis TaxID=485448 RepID=A0ABY7VGQ3_9GAMM|nr:response regulator [Thalassomonas haliotis]WDE12648.1 response regulator [Thalassomonas haliotis]
MDVPQTSPDTENKSILLIDDQYMLIISISKVLESWGYRVTSHTDPLEALESFKKKSYLLVICDLYMTTFSGYKLMRRFLKENPKQACSIMTSADDDEPLLKKTLCLENVKGVLKKPIIFEELHLLLEGMQSLVE